MSLTSYRAAPPRVELLSMGPRLRGRALAAKVRFARLSLAAVMSLTRSHATRTGACDGLFAREREALCDRMRDFFLEDLAVTYSPAS